MEKNKIMMLSIIILLVVLLATIAAGFFITLKKINQEPSAEGQVQTEAPASPEEIILFDVADSIYTNLKKGDDGKEHIIKLGVSLGIDNTDKKKGEPYKTELEAKIPMIKDTVIGILRNKTYDELQQADAQNILREEILERLQQDFNTNLIVNVYLSDMFLN